MVHRGTDRWRELSHLCQKDLLPTLRPGDIVVMDNLCSDKRKIVRRLIRFARAKLFFLPKYSPDLNRIERSSPSSNICFERPPREPLMRFTQP